jgi:hypothetical protein
MDIIRAQYDVYTYVRLLVWPISPLMAVSSLRLSCFIIDYHIHAVMISRLVPQISSRYHFGILHDRHGAVFVLNHIMRLCKLTMPASRNSIAM